MYNDYQLPEETATNSWMFIAIIAIVSLLSLLTWIWLLYSVYKIKQSLGHSLKESAYLKAKQSLFAGNKTEAKELFLKGMYTELSNNDRFKAMKIDEQKNYLSQMAKSRKVKMETYGISEEELIEKVDYFK